jgi:hypothetical protein
VNKKKQKNLCLWGMGCSGATTHAPKFKNFGAAFSKAAAFLKVLP